jgi:hypothetical protein
LQPELFIFRTVSTLTSIIFTPILYSIIWFEKDNHIRTLINLVITSLVWCGILWNIIIQPWTLVRYLIGPIHSQLICNIDFLLRNVCLMEVSLLQVAIFSVRYICMVYVKNPTALQDDFWHLFVNIWTVGCSIISQSVYIILPGKSPLNYYLCLGEYPIELHGVQVKANIPHLISGLLSILVFVCAKLTNRKIGPVQEELTAYTNTQNLFTFTTYGVALLLVFLLSYIPTKVNLLEGEELDAYPNYILVYALHHYFPQIIICTLTLTFFHGKPLMRKKVWLKMKELFHA